MSRYVFSSHDGFGLGHVRRNLRIAEALLSLDPDAEITVVTGVATLPKWTLADSIEVVTVPGLVKDRDGVYRNPGMSFEEALAVRSDIFCSVVADRCPNVVLVDRHPFGIGGELRQGLDLARRRGGQLIVGLRDILDDAHRVQQELAGSGWEGVEDLFSEILVYGDRSVCDHRREYGLPMVPAYCGWVSEAGRTRTIARHGDPLLVIAAGGGGDGRAVYELGRDLIRARPNWRARVLAGPFSGEVDDGGDQRIEYVRGGGGASALADASAVLQMAGYNATFEALAAGLRPILLPRREPRREQAIRSARLAAFGLVDVVDAGASAEEVAWLLDRPRALPAGALARSGIRLDGAERAAEHLVVAAAESERHDRIAA